MPTIARLPDFLAKVRDYAVKIYAAGNANGYDVHTLPADGSRTALILQRLTNVGTANGPVGIQSSIMVGFGRVPTTFSATGGQAFYDPANGFQAFPNPSGGIMLDTVASFTAAAGFVGIARPLFLTRRIAPIQETIILRSFDTIYNYVQIMEFRGAEGLAAAEAITVPPSGLGA